MVLGKWFLRPCTIRTWYLGSIKNNIEVLISNCPALVVFWKSLSAGATCFTSAKSRGVRLPAPDDGSPPDDWNYGNYGELWGIMGNYGGLWWNYGEFVWNYG